MLQRGRKPRRQHEHATGEREHRQTCSDGQSRREARSGLNITAALAGSAEEALVERPRRRRGERGKRDWLAVARPGADAAAPARVGRVRERPDALRHPEQAQRVLWRGRHRRSRRQRQHGPRRERRRRQQRREECHDMLQRGQVPRQQQWHEHGMPGERQSCLHVQDERQVRRPATVATAARAGSRRGRRLARGETTTRDDRAGHHGRGTMCGRRDCGATGSRSNTSARRRADTECPVTMGVAMLEARRGLSGRSTVIGARHAAGATRRGSLGAGGSGAAAAAAEFLVPGRRPRPQRLEGSSPRRGRRPRHRERERQRASYAAISAMSSA